MFHKISSEENILESFMKLVVFISGLSVKVICRFMQLVEQRKVEGNHRIHLFLRLKNGDIFLIVASIM